MGISNGNAAHGYHTGTSGESLLYVFLGLDATSEIYHEVRLGGDGFQYCIIYNMLRLGSIQIYYVESLKSQLLKVFCYFGWIVIIDLLLVVIAFGQAHALTVYQVDGWN